MTSAAAPPSLSCERFGDGAWSLSRADLPVDLVQRASVLGAVAEALGDPRDAVVGSRSVVVTGSRPSPAELACVERALSSARGSPSRPERASHVLPVVFDGPDLAAAAAALGLGEGALVERVTAPSYTAVLTGFLPGFAYLAGASADLELPRRATPRTRVPPRSLGLAGPYAGVYPSASPGGWNLVGEALVDDLFDPRRAHPPRIGLLDRVRFEPADERARAAFREDAAPEAGSATSAPAARFVVRRLTGLATLQDRGRPSHRRFGVPSGGPLDRESYEELFEGLAFSSCIELVGGAIELELTQGTTWTMTNGEPPRRVGVGDVCRLHAGLHLARLLALGGDLAVPPVLGSRASLLGFAWAGALGRPLAKGDALDVRAVHPAPTRVPALLDAPEDVALEVEPTALGAELFATPRTLEVHPASSRVGTRLTSKEPAPSEREGGQVARGESGPVVPGAIQQTPDGALVVLGPDAATLGGYPIVGFLPERARSLLARLRPGRRVTLTREV